MKIYRHKNDDLINNNHDWEKNAEIKYYKTFPTVLYLFVDKEFENGFVTISPILPYIKSGDRPAFIISSQDDKDVFKTIANSFEYIWNKCD